MLGRVCAEGESGVVRHVQPFVPVGGPGVSEFDPVDEMTGAGVGRGPEPERAIHLPPTPVLANRAGCRREVGAGPRVPVAGLEGPQWSTDRTRGEDPGE